MSNRDSDIDQEGLGKIDLKKGYLTLPFTQDQFREFISGLFGKSEQLERSIEGDFEVDLGDVRNLHFLIENRISQQNKGVLGQFSAKIFYDDGSSIFLNSFNSLSNYVEPRAVIPVKVELSWQYLIQFADRNVPEKQEIEIYITTWDLDSNKELDAYSLFRSRKRSGFIFKVKYTARTWATDIDSMLTEHIKSIMKLPYRQGGLKRFIFSNNEAIGLVSGIIFFLLSVLGGFITTNRFIASRLRNTTNFLSKSSDLSSKIDFLVNYITGGEAARFYFFLAVFLLIMLVASIFVGALITSKADKQIRKSYILLTRKVQKKREADLQVEKNQLRNLLLSIALGIFVNLLSSYMFMYLTTK